MSSVYEPSPNTKIVNKKAERICLKCRNKFESTGPSNRICFRCRGSNAKQGKVTTTPGHNGRVVRGIIEKASQ